jgi:hypothetical protein
MTSPISMYRFIPNPTMRRYRSANPIARSAAKRYGFFYGKLLRTGAANFSASGLKRQDNDLTVIESADAAAFNRNFDARYASGEALLAGGTFAIPLTLGSWTTHRGKGKALLSMQRVSRPRPAARGLPEWRHGPRLR